MTATITFSWLDKNIEQEYEALDFRQTFSDQRQIFPKGLSHGKGQEGFEFISLCF